jgi:hypothetical protein
MQFINGQFLIEKQVINKIRVPYSEARYHIIWGSDIKTPLGDMCETHIRRALIMIRSYKADSLFNGYTVDQWRHFFSLELRLITILNDQRINQEEAAKLQRHYDHIMD